MNVQGKKLIVNIMTFARAPLVLTFMLFAVIDSYTPDHRMAIAATTALILAALTDLCDGMLARRWNVVSKFGSMADPLMDKFFYLVVFPTMLWMLGREPGESAHSLLMLCITVLYILRDQWITFLRSVGTLYDADCSASWVGKLRTATSFPVATAIYVYIALRPGFLPYQLIYALEWWLMLINLGSIISYTKNYMPYLKRSISDPE